MYYHGMSLTRKKPLVRHPKAKGNAYEKHIAERLSRFWPQVRRNLASGGQGGSDLCEVPEYAIECKKRERLELWPALKQTEAAASPTQTPLFIFARNRSRDWACMPLDDLEGLWEQLRAVERDDPKGPTGPTKEPAARLLGSTPHAGGPPLAQVGPVDQASEAGGHGVVPLSGAEGGSDA